MRAQRTPGRPRGFDLDATLDVIKELFWRRGFEAVSLADIMAATGLRKASLYAAYGDKLAMYRKALARYDAEEVTQILTVLSAPGAPRTRLEAFMDAPLIAAFDDADGRGCFLCNAAAERAAEDPGAAATIRKAFDRLERGLARVVSQLDPQAPPKDAAAAAAACLAAYAGLRVMARAGIARTTLEGARDRVLASLPAAAPSPASAPGGP